MGDFIVQLSILDPLYTLFGWLTRVLFNFFGNYGLAIIFLTIIIRAALIPLNIRSQKSMLKMQALSGKQAELQRQYGDDKEAYQEAFMKMQKENGAGGLSGCLLPFLQLFFIWPIYRIVSGPLIYLSQVSKENIEAMINLGNRFGESGIFEGRVGVDIHIGLIKALNENAQFLNECINQGLIRLDQMIDLHFLGMDLTVTPAWNPFVIAKDPATYLPMLIIPVLVVVTNIVMMQLTKIMKPGWKEEEEAKKRAKMNPARAGQAGDGKGAAEDVTQNTMKMMNWMMPVLMLVTTFTMPAAMGLYWIISGLMSIITSVIVYYMFTKPYEAKKAEIEAKKDAVFKKSGKAALAGADGEVDADASKKNGKKKKN
ncbi:MAG: membrane protein insertase YidC [Clostridiales bacterium]|jgi:YidC/Oxa1 family membrane protein insertase|nr:membrane protein insertase YidC [Clostridiales bacterium]